MSQGDVLSLLKQRMTRDTQSVPVSMHVPQHMFDELCEIARSRGFADAHSLLRYYVTQGMRADVEAREANVVSTPRLSKI